MLQNQYEKANKETVYLDLNSNLRILNRFVAVLPLNIFEMFRKHSDKTVLQLSDSRRSSFNKLRSVFPNDQSGPRDSIKSKVSGS